MSTLAESAPTVNFDAALLTATARAKAKYVDARLRIEKGLALVLADAVTDMTRVQPRWFTVRSASADTVYNVVSNGVTVCDCPDYQIHGTHNTEYACKHGYAVLLVRAARKLLQRDGFSGYRLPVADSHRCHAYHMATGNEGHARRLADGRTVFYPWGKNASVIVQHDELCYGPPVVQHAEEGA